MAQSRRMSPLSEGAVKPACRRLQCAGPLHAALPPLHFALLGIFLLFVGTARPGAPAATLEEMRAAVRPQIGEMMRAYRAADAAWKAGRGWSESTDSGTLGWSESSYLRDYVRCYRVSHDTYWLDKVVDHFDRMLANQTPPDARGFRRWTETVYGVALVRALPGENAEGMSLAPELQRPYATGEGKKVTGHRYRIALPEADHVVVTDLTDEREVASLEYRDGLAIAAIPGAKFTLKGPAKAGARFVVETTRPRAVDYAVHDGMVTYPIAQWIEIVRGDAALHARYGKKADEYVSVLDKQFRQKWERFWVDLPGGAGAYTFTDDPTERFPSCLLPHNQYLALGRTFLVLQAIPGVPNREVYREKAEKMARYFKANVRENAGAYVWNYWDPRADEPMKVSVRVEDTSHATIDVGFAVEACRRGIVFTTGDLKRLAATYVDVMWDKSEKDPKVASNVAGRRTAGDKRLISEWISLAVADPRVWDVAWASRNAAGKKWYTPQILETYDALAGITDEDRKAITE